MDYKTKIILSHSINHKVGFVVVCFVLIAMVIGGIAYAFLNTRFRNSFASSNLPHESHSFLASEINELNPGESTTITLHLNQNQNQPFTQFIPLRIKAEHGFVDGIRYNGEGVYSAQYTAPDFEVEDTLSYELMSEIQVNKISNTSGNLSPNNSGIIWTASQNFGTAVAYLGDIDGDGNDEIAVGSCCSHMFDIISVDSNFNVITRRRMDGSVRGLSMVRDSRFGSSLSSWIDSDGNGIKELIVGAPNSSRGGFGAGAFYIIYLDKDFNVINTREFIRRDISMQFGRTVANVGDVDGDGIEDILVTTERFRNSSGKVTLFLMNIDGTAHKEIEIDPRDTIPTITDGEGFGSSIGVVGDIDGDGVNEIAVGANGNDDGGNNQGAIYLISLTQNGSIGAFTKISRFTPILSRMNLGAFGDSVTSFLGDVNGDEISDFVACSGASDYTGKCLIFFMNRDKSVASFVEWKNNTGGLPNVLERSASSFGSSITVLPDYDNNGVNNVLVGARSTSDGIRFSGGVYPLRLDNRGFIMDTSNTIGSPFGESLIIKVMIQSQAQKEDWLPEFGLSREQNNSNDSVSSAITQIGIDIAGGQLTLDAPSGFGLGTVAVAAGFTSACGISDRMTIQDLRGANTGWDVSVRLFPFESQEFQGEFLPMIENNNSLLSITAGEMTYIEGPLFVPNDITQEIFVNSILQDGGSQEIAMGGFSTGAGAGKWGKDMLICQEIPPYSKASNYQSIIEITVI